MSRKGNTFVIIRKTRLEFHQTNPIAIQVNFTSAVP